MGQSNDVNYDDDCAAITSYEDLYFWCFLFVVPITTWLAFCIWKYNVYYQLFHLYNNRSSSSSNNNYINIDEMEQQQQRRGGGGASVVVVAVPVIARIIQKECKIVREFRGSSYDALVTIHNGQDNNKQEYGMRPFHFSVEYQITLQDQYHHDNNNNNNNNNDGGGNNHQKIQKKIEVPESYYRHYDCDDTIELHYLSDHPTSAILVQQLQNKKDGGWSLILFILLLECLVLKASIMAATANTNNDNECPSFGWFIILFSLVVPLCITWLYLNYYSSIRNKIEYTLFHGTDTSSFDNDIEVAKINNGD